MQRGAWVREAPPRGAVCVTADHQQPAKATLPPVEEHLQPCPSPATSLLQKDTDRNEVPSTDSAPVTWNGPLGMAKEAGAMQP